MRISGPLFAEPDRDTGQPGRVTPYLNLIGGVSADRRDGQMYGVWFLVHEPERRTDVAAIGMAVNYWFKLGGVTLYPSWPPGSSALDVRVQYHGLAGALAIELAAAMASPLGVHRCDECHLPYVPLRRRPRFDRRRYCPACSGPREEGPALRAASRAAKRAWWRDNKGRGSTRRVATGSNEGSNPRGQRRTQIDKIGS